MLAVEADGRLESSSEVSIQRSDWEVRERTARF